MSTEIKTTSTDSRHPYIEHFVQFNITVKKREITKIANALFEYMEKRYSIECEKSRILGAKTECECSHGKGCDGRTHFYEVLMEHIDLPLFFINTDHGIDSFINMVEDLGLEKKLEEEYLKEIGVKDSEDIDPVGRPFL